MRIQYKNSLLNALEVQIVDRLRLSRVEFELRHDIEFPGKPIEHLYFVEEGMASLTTTFQSGSQVEVGMFGYESVIGVSGLMGTKRSLNRVYTQIAGYGYRCLLADAHREFHLCGAFHHLVLRYVQAQLVQAMQSAGCNAMHEVDRRLARWLLLCSDRTRSLEFLMPQEFLAHMLGTRRTSVSAAAGRLKKRAIIGYTRGFIQIHDVKALERQACECYHAVKDYLDNSLEFDSAFTK